jgi:hypothetical protein
MMVIGNAVGRQAEQHGERFHHGVAADVCVVEHEAVARIVARGLDARDQAVILRPHRAVLELAHALVDQADHVLDAVGHRRVDGDAGRLRIVAQEPARGRAGVRLEDHLGDRDHLGEDLDLLVHAGPAAEEHVDDFLEVEQPERQLEVLRRQRLRALVEAVAVFVVRIDQEHAQVRSRLEDLATSTATPLDLPTPVVPNTAKCLRTMSSTLM